MLIQLVKMNFRATRFVVLVCVLNVLLYHAPLLLFALSNLESNAFFIVRVLAQLLLIVFSVTAVFFYLVSLVSLRLLKFVCVVIFMCNALAMYFISTYGVILDKSMMGNVFNTRAEESIEFFSAELVLYFFAFGLLPAFIIGKVRIMPAPTVRILSQASTAIFVCIMVIYVNGGVVLWFDQNSRRLGGLILPWSYTINSIRSLGDAPRFHGKTNQLPAPVTLSDKKVLLVLVIGETARADNFNAYGYARETNPLLAKSGAVFLQNTTACATYTSASIQCMLLPKGASKSNYEPLPSYLHRHNVEVIWRTNNWGEPKLRLQHYVKASQLRSQCSGPNCNFDEILLEGLLTRIAESTHDKILLVLHTKGSHGPAYNKRYPDAFEKYQPVCKTADLSKCSEAALVNAYDNTIVYTDYFLYRTITMLKEVQNRVTLMMYISDHGESLGEYGFYLHGAPKLIAPDFQLRIPFIVWMSDEFKHLKAIDESDLDRDSYSHANIFHSVLSGLGVSNSLYDEALDIFSKQK